ncbi:MAG: hypothetical protein Q8N63_08895 [Nanoarchaeota archaeon]|nr:hypothetical protein [Nanoarchaeota archaeon]
MARESLGRKIRKGIYGAVSVADEELDKLTENVSERRGCIGRIVRGVEGIAREVKKQVTPMHEEIKEKGGYAAAAKRTAQSVSDSVKGAYASLEKSVEDAFCTEGKLDSEKIKKVLENKGNAVKQYGPRAYNYLSGLALKGADSLSKDYHEFIPTTEELKTKYDEIGGKYQGVLFREHYDKCLAFHKKAEKNISKRAKYRAEILKDIKDSASCNKAELKRFFAWQVTQDERGVYSSKKIKTLDVYL